MGLTRESVAMNRKTVTEPPKTEFKLDISFFNEQFVNIKILIRTANKM